MALSAGHGGRPEASVSFARKERQVIGCWQWGYLSGRNITFLVAQMRKALYGNTISNFLVCLNIQMGYGYIPIVDSPVGR